jgi:AcrR family transcriptional regulator
MARDRENSTRRPRWKRRWAASGDTATKRHPCASSRPRWEFPVPASTTPSAANGRSSPPLWRATSISPRARTKRLEATRPPKDAIRQFIEEIIRRSLSDPERRGCLLINSALEIAPHDRELGAVIGGCLAEIEAFFRRSIKAAQKQGSVRTDLVAKDVARLLLGVVLGIRVLARARPERALLEGVARPALGLLD